MSIFLLVLQQMYTVSINNIVMSLSMSAWPEPGHHHGHCTILNCGERPTFCQQSGLTPASQYWHWSSLAWLAPYHCWQCCSPLSWPHWHGSTVILSESHTAGSVPHPAKTQQLQFWQIISHRRLQMISTLYTLTFHWKIFLIDSNKVIFKLKITIHPMSVQWNVFYNFIS